jgi:hypothetical protein
MPTCARSEDKLCLPGQHRPLLLLNVRMPRWRRFIPRYRVKLRLPLKTLGSKEPGDRGSENNPAERVIAL